MPATTRTCVCLAALLLLACNTQPPAADKASQPVAVMTDAPAIGATETEPASSETEAADPADNIYFQLRSTVIDEAEKLKLRERAERLKAISSSRFRIREIRTPACGTIS